MGTNSSEQTIIRFSEQHELTVRWQNLRFGYRRAIFTFDSYDKYVLARKCLSRFRSLHCEWNCHFEGTFEGCILVMDATDKVELDGKLAEEKARHDDWWQSYHNADEHTRKLMACGAIT